MLRRTCALKGSWVQFLYKKKQDPRLVLKIIQPRLAGHVTFLVVLCFWQRIREVVRKPRMVFMDKLCIPQEDEALKETRIQQGLMALGYFFSLRIR